MEELEQVNVSDIEQLFDAYDEDAIGKTSDMIIKF
jgi:hypothetical protein